MGKLATLFGLAVAGAAANYGVAKYFFHRTMERGGVGSTERTMKMSGTDWNRYIPLMTKCREWMEKRPREDVYLTSWDGLKLHATWLPEPGAKKTVICFHGYSSMGTNDYTGLSRFYLPKGYNMLLVDERAHGGSEGKYIGFGVLDRWDALDWIRYVEDRFGGEQEIVLHGTSMGGATVLMTVGLGLPGSVRGIVSDCAFTSAWEVFRSVLNTMYHLPATPILATANRMVKRHAGYGIADVNAAAEVARAKVPILLIHGEDDSFVPCRMGREIYENSPAGTELLIVKGAGHGEAYWKDTAAYEQKLSDFLERVEKTHEN